jgi:DNA-binding response OmpR family regulator
MEHDDPPAGARLIYIVEDNPEVARLIVRALRDFDFQTECFGTASELLRQVKRKTPALCIVDLKLPDMDGMELVRELRSNYDCGVLILTVRGDAPDRILGLESGADDYVVKPFDPRELVARVRTILRRSQRSTAVREGKGARFAGWRFDPRCNALTAPDGRELSLSVAEARMLLTFLKNPNRILTREQLLDERNLSPFDRSIDVRISRLRHKLEADPHNPKLIKTVYSAGYLFAASVEWE